MDSVSAVNTKAIGDAPAILSNLSIGNAIFNQNLQQQAAIQEQSALGIARLTAVSGLAEYSHNDPAQARSDSYTLTGDAVAQQLQSLLSSLNSGVLTTKAAMQVPPVAPA